MRNRLDGRVLSCILLMLILSACSAPSTQKSGYPGNKSNTSSQPNQSMQPDDLLYVILLSEYQYWAGSPYRFGGSTTRGVDCSSLVQQVYKKTFNITLPRTTEQQVRQGFSIRKSNLQVGDLVFFKTGWNDRHVGIYMGQGQFFHASTSQGVIMSELESPYWQKYYWQSRRVI